MSRLPVVGSDTDGWGGVLNDYLGVSINPDGTLKPISSSLVTGLVRTPRVVVAASNADTAWRSKADYVCTGTGDQSTINTALASLPNGGVVELSDGTFNVSGSIALSSNQTLVGQGPGATIINRSANVVTITVNGTNPTHAIRVGIRDLQVGGTRAFTASGLQAHYATQLDCRNVYINGIQGMGIDASELWDSNFVSCYVIDCGGQSGAGVPAIQVSDSSTDNSNNVRFFGCHVESWREGAVWFVSTSASFQTAYCRWIGGKIESNKVRGPAINFLGTTACEFVDSMIIVFGFDTGFSTPQPMVHVGGFNKQAWGDIIAHNYFQPQNSVASCLVEMDWVANPHIKENGGSSDGTLTLSYVSFPNANPNTNIDLDAINLSFDSSPPTNRISGIANVTSFASANLSLDPLSINVKQLGAIGDGSHAAADVAAFTKAINMINASVNGGEIVIPTPSSTYNITSALPALTKPCRIRGSVLGINNPGTIITYSAGLVGFDLTNSGASGSHVEGLHLKGSDTSLGTNDGIRLGSRTTVDYCQIESFGRDGLNADSSGGVINCNTCGGIGTRVVSNWRHGIFIKGANSNVHTWTRLEAFNNKAWGIFNAGLYTNTFIGPLCDGNGATALRTPLSVADAVFNGTTTVTSATAAFATTDVGAVLLDNASGTLVPAPTTLTQNADTTLATRVSATQITMSQAAAGSGSGKSLWIVAPGAIYDGSGGSTYINPYVEGPHNGNWVCLNGKYTDWQGDASAVVPITDATHFVAPNYWNFYQRVSAIGRMLGGQLFQGFQGDQVTSTTTQWSLGPGGGAGSWGNFSLFDYISGQRYIEASGSLVGFGLLGATPVANKVTVGADVDVSTVGKGLQIKEGTNAKQGVATLSAGTVVVSNTSVTAISRIQLTAQSLGTVTTPKALAVTARTAGTSFTITSSDATDTSVVAYEIFEPG